jgi:diacylglycerol O-acyltransferase / wax synthase
MSARLTPLDATFLELEEADESAHMHIGGVMVFDPLPAGGAPSLELVRRHLAARLQALPRYGQRLSEPHTGGLSWPEWRDDPGYTVARHVTRAALPAPGGDRELHEWASGFFSQRLDRRRPLWEMALVEGLAEGRWALATKTHHSMVDGVGSVDVAHVLLDTVADASPELPPEAPPAARAHAHARNGAANGAAPSALAQARAGVAALAHAAEAGARSVLHPRKTLASARAALDLVVRDEIHGAPHTSLNEPIGTLRRFAAMRAPLSDLKLIKAALGGTVNDVALATVAGGLRALLLGRGEQPPAQGLRAMVPVNVRASSERLALGNRVSSLFVELPVAQPDPLERYRETVARSRALKSDGHQAAGSSAMIDIAGLAPPVIHVVLAQSLYATRLFNLTITNVPGPQQTLYALGAPLREIHPLVPLAASHAVGVALISYDRNMFFGVVCDRDSVPDLDVMTAAMERSLEELRALALPAATPSAPHRRRALAER